MKTIEKPVNIPKSLTRGKDLVVLTKEEYVHIIEHRDESLKLLSIIAEGEKSYREGKTVCASSLEEALKIHAKH